VPGELAFLAVADTGLDAGCGLAFDVGCGLGLDAGCNLGLDVGCGLGLDAGCGLGFDPEEDPSTLCTAVPTVVTGGGATAGLALGDVGAEPELIAEVALGEDRGCGRPVEPTNDPEPPRVAALGRPVAGTAEGLVAGAEAGAKGVPAANPSCDRRGR
jgi:hypothetical protein